MKHLAPSLPGALAASLAVLAVPLVAQDGDQTLTPGSFRNLARVFAAADMDDNGSLSRAEFVKLRLNAIESEFLPNYESTSYPRIIPSVERSFARLDRDNDGMISQAEFMQAANDAPAADPLITYYWSWAPEFITVSYFLEANRMSTDAIIGRDVVNLKDEKIGEIQKVIRDKNSGAYYAMIDIDGRMRPNFPSLVARQEAGVPLSDILLGLSGDVLYLSNKGEDFLRETEARMVEDFEEVEYLYRTP